MNQPSDSNENLLQCLVSETKNLALMAAREARRTRALRRRCYHQLSFFSVLLFSGICIWLVLVRFGSRHEITNKHVFPDKSNVSAKPTHKLIARTLDQAKNQTLPAPAGITVHQQKVLESGRGLPFVIVHDNMGKRVRIYVVER